MKRIATILLLITCTSAAQIINPGGSGSGAFAGGSGNSFQDAQEISAPANPASGSDRLYMDSTSHTLKCLTNAGGNCLPTGNTANSLTMNNSGTGAASGATFNGSAGVTLSYNTLGAAPLASPTFTGTVTIPALTLSGITGSTQCLHVNSSGVTSGTGSDCVTGGSTAWSSLTNPAGNLSLTTMGTNTTTFTYASALANAWTWQNTAAATSGTAQSSPLLYVCGQGWEGGTPGNTADCWSIQNSIANGSNPEVDLSFVNTGASTGLKTLLAPNYKTSGSNGGITGTEGTGAGLTAAAGNDLFYPDSTNHCWHQNLNNSDKGCVPFSFTAPLGNTNGVVAITANGISATQLAAQYAKLRCEPGLGDGLNAISAGTYLQTECYNDSGVTWTITGIKCFTDNNGTSTLNATNSAATGLLTGAVTCTSSFAAGTQSGTTTLANGDYIKFTFVADGTSKQTTWVVSLTQ